MLKIYQHQAGQKERAITKCFNQMPWLHKFLINGQQESCVVGVKK